jgi:hypothetical protein
MAWHLLTPLRWGFQGPSNRRRRDTIFRARRRSFFVGAYAGKRQSDLQEMRSSANVDWHAAQYWQQTEDEHL